jgi:hypothetical protein
MGGQLVGGTSGMVLALAFAAVMNLGAWWWSDRLVLRMYGAREVSEAAAPELYGIVRALAQRACIPMPRVYLIPENAPNAFATGRSPQHAAVAVTEVSLAKTSCGSQVVDQSALMRSSFQLDDLSPTPPTSASPLPLWRPPPVGPRESGFASAARRVQTNGDPAAAPQK